VHISVETAIHAGFRIVRPELPGAIVDRTAAARAALHIFRLNFAIDPARTALFIIFFCGTPTVL
jgi:hypothetical protein